MEAAGLSIGLVGLIDPVIQLIGIVKAYRSFTSDSDALNAQFEAERLRLERWKRSAGPDRQLSADHQTRLVVENLLSAIDGILERKESLHKTEQAKSDPLNNAISSRVDQHHTREGDAGSKRRKLIWALGRKRDLTDLVTQFGKVVQQVHDLVPPDQAANTQSTTDNRSLESVRGTDPRSNVPGTGAKPEHGSLVELHQTLTEIRQALAKAQGESGTSVMRLKLMKTGSRHATGDS